jgi:hypothetical protein
LQAACRRHPAQFTPDSYLSSSKPTDILQLSAASYLPGTYLSSVCTRNRRKDAINPAEGAAQGQGAAHLDAVRIHVPLTKSDFVAKRQCSGLDNAGKTTIVKRIMGEDVNTVSPTLGFIIKTIDYDGYALLFILCPFGSLLILAYLSQIQAQHL